MQNFFLILHLLIALARILTVLLQRSEGGGLGIGGGGGGNISGRPPASPIAKFTWWLSMAFLVTSLSLNWLARSDQGTGSVIDQLGVETAPSDGLALPPTDGLLPPTDGILPPPPVNDLVPPPPAE